jgi:DnaJ homolog subfamily C member 2
LRHHPDKKSGGNDNYFKCIQKAWEILSDPVKRRQFDSVDPEFDESIPEINSKGNFFEVYGDVFRRNARFLRIPDVPELGAMDTDEEDVNHFYHVWFNFDSWRSFEYMDEELPGDLDNREDRRYIEKKNRAERSRLKKEDNQRLLRLVGK